MKCVRLIIGSIMICCLVIHSIVPAVSDDHLDNTLPREISVAPYEGKYYDALVPDTLDLVEHANKSLNVLTRCVAPQYDYEQYTEYVYK